MEGDAGVDSGVVFFPCKSLTCNGSEEYCKLTPVGECTLDAGVCGAGQEECVSSGTGCTPERTAACEALNGFTQCAQFFASDPCGPGLINFTCREIGGTITVECPYP